MNKHIAKPDNNVPFHTSGYAQVANGDRVGSTSTISFDKRRQIDQNRLKVAGYGRSIVGNYRSGLRPKQVAERDVISRPAMNQRQISENPPSPRPYNPYS